MFILNEPDWREKAYSAMTPQTLALLDYLRDTYFGDLTYQDNRMMDENTIVDYVDCVILGVRPRPFGN